MQTVCNPIKPTFNPELPNDTKRKKLWQIDTSFYCAILGTCLTIAELEKVARQCKIPLQQDLTDYDLHRTFVSTANRSCPSSRQLNKLLDKKYKTPINRLSKCRSHHALGEHWADAMISGDIAGIFWAISSHPLANDTLLNQVYGDVHMLSHLAGSSNRVNIQQLKSLKQDLHEVQQTQSESHKAYREQLRMKDQRIHALEQEILKLLSKTSTRTAEPQPDTQEIEKKLDSYARHADWAEQKLSTAEMKLTQSAHEISGLQELLIEVKEDKEAAEQALTLMLGEKTRNINGSQNDLAGRQIAYVGGRTSLSPHFRNLVERYNGKFSFHDGGQEDSRANLTCALNSADVVFCPIDCVSHDACLRVKRFCKQHAKTFIPLRSSGLSAFTRELQGAISLRDSPKYSTMTN